VRARKRWDENTTLAFSFFLGRKKVAKDVMLTFNFFILVQAKSNYNLWPLIG